MTLASYQPALEAHLADVLASGDVPGAAVAVMHGAESIAAAAGLRNVATGEPATADTLWQIGSVSKIYTATLAAMLAAEGRLDLDAPVSRYLAGGRLATAEPDLAEGITARQLLTHTSGLDADRYFHAEGEAGAADAFLDALGDVRHVLPPGTAYSYSNPGYGLLEALISTIAGEAFGDLLHRRLLHPIEASRTEVRLDRAVAHRLALGHVKRAGEDGFRGPRWRWIDLSPGVGGVVAALPDVLKFARLHLDRDDRVLGLDWKQRMQEPGVSVPVLSRRSAVGRGLGWAVHRWGDLTLVSHDGDTVGQQALLLLAPRHDFAIAAAGASNRAGPLLFALAEAVIADRLGVRPAEPEAKPEVKIACGGRYERLHLAWEVEDIETGGIIRADPDALFAPGYDRMPQPMRPLGGQAYAVGDAADALRLLFLDVAAAGRATHLYMNGRVHPLTAPR